MNRADKINATANWVNKWRLDNGFTLPDGTPNKNISPSKDLVPFRWMHPFLKQVKLEELKLAQINADGTYRYDHDPQSELWRRSGEQGPIKIDPKLQKRIDSLKSTFPWNQARVDYSGIPNERDLKIRDVINKYGKDKDGTYKNPELLIKNLPRA